MATRNPLISQPFALAGDTTIPPVPAQGSGSVSFNQGWGPNYQADPNTDPNAKPVERSVMNALFNILTSNLMQYQREGVPEFIAAADNGGVAVQYPVGAMVMWRTGTDPFRAYINTLNNNVNIPSHVSWLDLANVVGGALQRTGGTMTGALALFAGSTAPTPTTGNRSTQIATTQMFASEFTGSPGSFAGWTKLPNGLILQWGFETILASGTTVGAKSVVFPIAFPNLCHIVIGNPIGVANSSNGGMPACGFTNRTLTQATCVLDTLFSTTINQNVIVTYFAIGN